MSKHLLATKFFVPPPLPGHVPRPRLNAQLNEGLRGKLTLVSAPAGFGKSTLLSQWIPTSERHVSWVSIDESDNNPTRFWTYVITSLQSLQADFAEDTLAILDAPKPPDSEILQTQLINDINELPEQLILVLDDYHLIETQSIHDSLAFLVRHQPPQMHVIIAGRTDPPIHLAQLRAQGQLAEIRTSDLRFTVEEAAVFLTETMSLPVSSEDVSALEARTEGWIAGLLLAAVSMRGREDTAGFLEAFSGSHRFVIDYLVEEVLNQQSQNLQDFLLKTSILERMNASLCNAVTERQDSQENLNHLENANLFLIPLDDQRIWYRYHQLFADFLKQRLFVKAPQLLSELYQRASAWAEEQGDIESAINYSLTSGDEARATHLLDSISIQLINTSEISFLLHWIDRLPEKLWHNYPRLCLARAWAMNFSHQFEAIEPALALAEAHLHHPDNLPADLPPNVLKAFIEGVRAYAATWQGHYEEAIDRSQIALQHLPGEKSDLSTLLQAALNLNLGIAYSRSGQVIEGEQILTEAIAQNRATNNLYATLGAIGDLMRLQIATGQLAQAHRIGQQGLSWSKAWSQSTNRFFPAADELLIELGSLTYEQNQLENTHAYLEQAQGLYRLWGNWGRVRYFDQMFILYQALGDLASAMECQQKIVDLSPTLNPSRKRLVEASSIVRGMLLLRLNPELIQFLDRGRQWAETAGLQPEDDFSYEQENEYAAFARLLITDGKASQARGLIERLCQAAETSSRKGDLIKYYVLLTLAFHSLAQQDQALEALARSLQLAEPAGFVRTFVDEGQLLEQLLQQAASRGVSTHYVRKLLAAFPASTVSAGTSAQSLPEPLTERELEVLQLMGAGLTGTEIAEQLFLSVNTIKTHTRNIYGKLGVNKRSEAIQRAKALGLLSN